MVFWWSPGFLYINQESCPTLCDPMDCSLPGSSVHGVFQAWILEWVVISFSRGSSRPRDQTWVSCFAGRCFTLWAAREALHIYKIMPHVNRRLTSTIWIFFISFPCLIILDRTSNIKLSESGESGDLCLILGVRGEHFYFSLLIGCSVQFSSVAQSCLTLCGPMLAMVLSRMAFVMVRYAPYGYWLLQVFSASMRSNNFYFVNIAYHIDWPVATDPTL